MKLTAKRIDDRVQRSLDGVIRALARGDITEAQAEQVIGDIARWSAEQYARLPQAQATDAILSLLLGKDDPP